MRKPGRTKAAASNPSPQQGPYVAHSSPQEIDDLAPVHWINPTTERYYAARLILNLFGQWELQQAWGSLNSRRGRLRYLPLASRADGQCHLATLSRRRAQRGYMSQPIVPAA